MNARSLTPPILALAALVAGSGCNHLTTHVPGVLDMRTDGAAAAPATVKPGAAARAGFDSIVYGEGVTGTSDVKVIDRKYWACAFFPVLNESATEEITMSMGPTGALRNVRIGEQFTVMNWFMGVVVRAIPVVNVLGIIMPPHDFYFWGTPVSTGADVALPPPTDAPPPPDAPPALAPETPAAAPAPAPGT